MITYFYIKSSEWCGELEDEEILEGFFIFLLDLLLSPLEIIFGIPYFMVVKFILRKIDIENKKNNREV